ncbi:MAG TPA: trypsin-like peptidase domain-containing protein [Candidatus Binatia bacterium]|nr:trypsin-like peptidase domain-containing protein [Candidatus Binatia bacterium]
MTRVRLGGARLFVILAALITALSVSAQESRLMPDERNTIEIFRRASQGVVHIRARTAMTSPFETHPMDTSTGTGFLIDSDGRILTAFHVIKDKDEITVVLNSRRALTARLLGTAPQLDIALLQIDAPKNELFPLVLGNSGSLEIGQKVMAIGNAVGLHNSLTVGVISALQRSIGDTAVELEDAFIQTDAAINPGNSGGPLLNSAGEVVGINDAMIERAQNIGFAIPIDLAHSVIPDLIEMGHPYRPVLGFSGSEITPSLAKLFGLPLGRGFLIEEVLPNSPAAEAGLRAGGRMVMVGEKPYVLGGDIVVGVNGEAFAAPSQLAQVLLRSRPGQMLQLQVYRQGRTLDVSVPLLKMQMQF